MSELSLDACQKVVGEYGDENMPFHAQVFGMVHRPHAQFSFQALEDSSTWLSIM